MLGGTLSVTACACEGMRSQWMTKPSPSRCRPFQPCEDVATSRAAVPSAERPCARPLDCDGPAPSSLLTPVDCNGAPLCCACPAGRARAAGWHQGRVGDGHTAALARGAVCRRAGRSRCGLCIRLRALWLEATHARAPCVPRSHIVGLRACRPMLLTRAVGGSRWSGTC